MEINALAAKTYRLNHPDVHLWERDIRSLRVTAVREALQLQKGGLDLLAGCPPCQGFSTLRTLNGRKCNRDPRNALTDDFLRFVRGLMPATIMLENVPGLGEHSRFTKLASALRRLGYVVNWSILNAADYGVPQRRRRLILLAAVDKRIEFAAADSRAPTVRDALSVLGNPGLGDDPLHRVLGPRRTRTMDLIRAIPKDGGSRTDLPPEKWLPCHRKCDGFYDVYGRMSWDNAAPTITSGCLNPSKGRFLHPSEDRAITAREAALLQTFPVAYRFSTERGMYAVARMIGNALPPEFIRRHALQLAAAIKDQRAAVAAPPME